MRESRTAFLGIILAVAASCNHASPAADDAAGSLIVAAADPLRGLEARYSEAGHAVVLRSRPSASGPVAAILDEADRSVTDLAAAATARFTSDRQSRARPEAARLVEQADRLAAAVLLSRQVCAVLATAMDAAGLMIAAVHP
ncbi:MAG TPA: hypothetical protein VIX73_30645 [Kofleriaceae bacterium]|jgi:hypothetical protein